MKITLFLVFQSYQYKDGKKINLSNLACKTLIYNNCQYKNNNRLLLLCDNIKIHLIKRSKTTHKTLSEVRQNTKKPKSPYRNLLLIVPISTFLLGTWQLQRRQWKLKLIEDLERQITADPIDLIENVNQLDTLEYRTVKVKGQYLYEKEFLIGPRAAIYHNNNTDVGNLFGTRNTNGWNVITPFKVENQDLTILINRGWIPEKSKRLPRSQIEGIVEINGVVRKQENRPPFNTSNIPEKGLWYYRDIKTMAKVAGTSPIFLDLWSKVDPPDGPISCQTTVSIRNEHFSYMITWYTLSLCTLAMWYKGSKKMVPISF
ncbi:PREDICTED: surfeit locus protein 1 [Polistes dominula]|uniref:SURF1-like protein n=1 Tax=Polistes dominula TaxID=743375 RepID=A0ABM1J9G0_POLDO|nr:PREDICTED: surfeit locus protein 1 [Polistes dominula]